MKLFLLNAFICASSATAYFKIERNDASGRFRRLECSEKLIAG